MLNFVKKLIRQRNRDEFEEIEQKSNLELDEQQKGFELNLVRKHENMRIAENFEGKKTFFESCIKCDWYRLSLILQEKLPESLGIDSTPNAVKRQFYKIKSIIEEIDKLMDSIEKWKSDAIEFFIEIENPVREANENSFWDFIEKFDLKSKYIDANNFKKIWKDRLNSLEGYRNYPGIL